MKLRLIFTLFCFVFSAKVFAQEIFHTSVCYDLLSTVDKFDNIDDLGDFYVNSGLVKDSAFIACASTINKSVRASNLCNLYSVSKLDKNDIKKCIEFFEGLEMSDVPRGYHGDWLNQIFNVKNELVTFLTLMYNAGYNEYWMQSVKPKLEKSIKDYNVSYSLLDSIHCEINVLAGPDTLSVEYPKTYVLDINNAFNLIDETFCTSYFLLNKEVAKKYRINFIQVYIHENLHRLGVSTKTMERLEKLLELDEFYRVNEEKAQKYGEGKNEAFVVAAESYISYNLGLKSISDVCTEFKNYCDGSLVLAPIIYSYLKEKRADESYDSFINRLFDEGKIVGGKVQEQYGVAMGGIVVSGEVVGE